MTLAAVYAEAVRVGLQEICVVKHYSHDLPNRSDRWVNWKRTKPEAFYGFLEEFRNTPAPAGLHVLAGVETEVINTAGDINIPAWQVAHLDMALVSNHWLPEGPGLARSWMPLLGEGRGKLPLYRPVETLGPWLSDLEEAGPEPYVRAVCEANANAIRRNPKVKVLAHLDDGLHVLRQFRVPVESMSDDRLIELAIPVMQACVERQVLWEVSTLEGVRTSIVQEANRRGVTFTATADAHFLTKADWGYTLGQHGQIEDVVRNAGLRRGRVVIG
jgi:histidinol phosphatase-like PHP family hydrolase